MVPRYIICEKRNSIRPMQCSNNHNEQMIFFPEASDFIASNTKETIELTRAHSKSFVEDIKKEARNQKLWVSIGVHERGNI